MKKMMLTALLTAGLALPVATPAWAQRGGGSHGGGGHATSGGGHAMSAPRSSGGTARASGRGGAPATGHAVPRGSVVGPARGVRPGGYGYYSPYYGFYGPALGLGLGYYGYYGDPFWDDPYWGFGYPAYGYPGYGYPAYGYAAPYVVPPGSVTGGLRIEVTPKTAEVYVDGYYAGIVDDFNGHFQHVDLTPGSHHIEVRAPGYETLTFDVNIQADHTTHYKGSLVPTAGATQ